MRTTVTVNGNKFALALFIIIAAVLLVCGGYTLVERLSWDSYEEQFEVVRVYTEDKPKTVRYKTSTGRRRTREVMKTYYYADVVIQGKTWKLSISKSKYKQMEAGDTILVKYYVDPDTDKVVEAKFKKLVQ